MPMRAIAAAAAAAAIVVSGDVNVARGRPTTVIGCPLLAQLKNVFPTAKAAGFTERLQTLAQYPRHPVYPGRCGAFWTTYKGDGESMEIGVTLYKTSAEVAPALAEPSYGPVHVLANGARIRTDGPSPGSVNGTASSSTGAVTAFRNLFISSGSISTRLTPVPVAAQLRIHRLVENTFARIRLTH
jgi:hypothetical protein